ncbi:MAG: tail protein X [Campylobacter sp.]
MKRYVAKDNESLDMICYKFYGSIQTEIYSQFLRENEPLLQKTKLNGGDIVNLPDISPKIKKEVKYLWQ